MNQGLKLILDFGKHGKHGKHDVIVIPIIRLIIGNCKRNNLLCGDIVGKTKEHIESFS